MGTHTKVDGPVIFFDGVCNLCNASVTFIIKRDRKHFFKFSSLQSRYAGEVLPNDFIKNNLQTLVLIINGQILIKSSAALTIARHLSGLWSVLYVLMIIPPFVRHFIYDLVAKNRYKLFGKKDQCVISTPELRDHFID